jgi:uncharacterized protein
MNISFPYHISSLGCTATTNYADHVRDMIELVLFTNPGERVMRPDYGTGVLQYVHGPNSPEVAATLQATVQAALARWLGDVIDVTQATVESVGAELRVTVRYLLRASGEIQVETFSRPLP